MLYINKKDSSVRIRRYRGFTLFGRVCLSYKKTPVMNSSVLVILSLVLIVWSAYASSLPFTGSCDSCGRECQSACGTRGFRTCCLNYLKKRSTPTSTGSEMKLELMMVLPKLAQFYPPLRSLIPESSQQNQLKMLFEKPKMKNSDSEKD